MVRRLTDGRHTLPMLQGVSKSRSLGKLWTFDRRRLRQETVVFAPPLRISLAVSQGSYLSHSILRRHRATKPKRRSTTAI
jgi:hypothetical protein